MADAEPTTVREATIENHILASCPDCGDWMLLGEWWRDLILEDGHEIPCCPGCEPAEWADDADVVLDATEVWALSGDVIQRTAAAADQEGSR